MSFGLTNAPMTFMNSMNKMFRKYVDMFVIVFIDYLWIYSWNDNGNMDHLRIM